MTADSELSAAFMNVGKEYGYEEVNAEFSAFKEMKIKWQRSKGKAKFILSDYLAIAPPDVIDGLARTLFRKICTSNTLSYPEEVTEWLGSDGFVETNRPTYLRRARNLTRSHAGDNRDLHDSYARVVKLGLVPDGLDIVFSWTMEANLRRVGYCSPLMRVIAISSVFDNDMIPEAVLDYVVYHEILHVMGGHDPFGKKHSPEFRAKERRYPGWEDAEKLLKRLQLMM